MNLNIKTCRTAAVCSSDSRTSPSPSWSESMSPGPAETTGLQPAGGAGNLGPSNWQGDKPRQQRHYLLLLLSVELVVVLYIECFSQFKIIKRAVWRFEFFHKTAAWLLQSKPVRVHRRGTFGLRVSTSRVPVAPWFCPVIHQASRHSGSVFPARLSHFNVFFFILPGLQSRLQSEMVSSI